MTFLKTAIRPLLLATALHVPGVQAVDFVDINRASAEALSAALVGVGLAKAEAIVAYRDAHGPFVSADDLVLVSGIGEATVARNRERIRIAPSEGAGPVAAD